MNPFTAHPQEQGVSYVEHYHFAMGIACRLLSSVFVFALHAILPCIPIAPHHDLEKVTAFLVERNQWIENAKDTSYTDVQPGFGDVEPSMVQRHIAIS